MPKLKIKPGSLVEVINPMVVARVGYPKGLQDYKPRAFELLKPVFEALDPKWRCHSQNDYPSLINGLAYELGIKDGFGGNIRKVHLKEGPLKVGEKFNVDSKRVVREGERFPGYRGRSSYYGDVDDSEGPSFKHSRTVVLVSYSHYVFDKRRIFDIEYPLDHVKLVEECNV